MRIEKLYGNRDFEFLSSSSDGSLSQEEADEEFKRLYKEIESEYEIYKNKNEKDIPNYSANHKTELKDIDKYGILGYIMLHCNRSGLLFKYASPELKRLVRLQAIKMFGSFDEDTRTVSQVLCDADLIDKDMYIILYQKALGRNYDLKEFESFMSSYTKGSAFIEDAIGEIKSRLFLPCPRGKWQKSDNPHGKRHRITKITIPPNISKGKEKNELMEMLKKNLSETKRVQAETDMIGKRKDGTIIEVDNLYDWYFGIDGVQGYLQINQDGKICLPPQTPEKVIELVKDSMSKELDSMVVE